MSSSASLLPYGRSPEPSRVPPALQLPRVFRAAIGREMRRTRIGGIAIKSAIAVFG
jgi:hypothetical protein